MRSLLRWYGAGPLNLLCLLGCFALAGYAAAQLISSRPLGVAVWFLGAVIGHDLLLVPLYSLADRSARTVIRHRDPGLPAVRWINYVRVPAALSGLLLLVWFPLILRLSTAYHASTTLSPAPYLWHWLAVTGALFLLSAVAFAVRLRRTPGETPPPDDRAHSAVNGIRATLLRSSQESRGAAKGDAVTESWPGDWAVGNGDEPDVDTSVANPARMWNYWVGGKDNFRADRAAADSLLELLPSLPQIARLTRYFLIDAVHRLAADYGIRQFLDIGTGLPTADNTHDVAQRVAGDARIVYVDNDPVVLTHARALLTSNPGGRTDFLHADLRDTPRILAGAARTLDFSQPVAVMLIAVLHFIPDSDDPYKVVARLMDAVPPGSCLVLAHGASDIEPEAVAEMMQRYNALSSVPLTLRTRPEVTRFFDGLELIPPGMVPLPEWGSSGAAGTDAAGGMAGYCGIGFKR
jgi:hypothetical protein